MLASPPLVTETVCHMVSLSGPVFNLQEMVSQEAPKALG
jgi:hypothetical protein